jgi:hypothetical protein
MAIFSAHDKSGSRIDLRLPDRDSFSDPRLLLGRRAIVRIDNRGHVTSTSDPGDICQAPRFPLFTFRPFDSLDACLCRACRDAQGRLFKLCLPFASLADLANKGGDRATCPP